MCGGTRRGVVQSAPAVHARPGRGVGGMVDGAAPRALTIAGSDSGGGAGVQADLKTFTAFRVFGMSALTAVTAQNTLGVRSWEAVPATLVRAQIEAVREDLGVDATKVGMLGAADAVRAVADALRGGGLGPVVLDPVMVSKGGDVLLRPDAVRALREELLPLADVLTPNLSEAAALLGCDARELSDPPARRQAARALAALGPRCVVVKGGHAAGGEALDVWWGPEGSGELSGPRYETRHTHGTGCTFSAAVAAGLAHGWPLSRALRVAKAFVAWAIAHAPGLGRGHGPLQHLLPDAEWERIQAEAAPS